MTTRVSDVPERELAASPLHGNEGLDDREDTPSVGGGLDSRGLVDGVFASPARWDASDADCLVVCCSDHRFRPHSIEFLKACGYTDLHVISFPSGVAILHSLVASIGFLSKAADLMIAKAIEVTGVREIVCIAHEDCGGYKAGRVELIGKITRRLSGRSIEEIQQEHLAKSAKALSRSFRDVRVRAFFADLVEGESGAKTVVFREVRFR